MTQDGKNIRPAIGAAVLRLLLTPLAILPLKCRLCLAEFLAWILRDVAAYRRNEVMINLARSFPEKKYKELAKISKRFYLHLADIFVETIWFGACRGERGRKRLNDSRIVDIANPEVFNEVYENSTNVLVLSSHCGNWELLGGWFNYNHDSKHPLSSDVSEIGVVYKQLSSKTWNRFMADNRCAPLLDTDFRGYLETKEVFRFAITNRNRKFIYIFPTDQYPYGNAIKHDIGRFLNQDTMVMTGGTALACKFGMSVSYLRWKSVDRGRYLVELVPICKDASGETPEGLMRKYYDLLEKDIQDQPWNYLWSHRRWK